VSNAASVNLNQSARVISLNNTKTALPESVGPFEKMR